MAGRYLLDSQKSKFSVQAFATGMLAGFAHNPRFAIKQFDGELQFEQENRGQSSFAMTVKADSLELIDKVKEDKHVQIQAVLMDDVLQVKRCPVISFRSSNIASTRIADDWFRAQIGGDMRLCDISKPVSIDSQLRFAGREARLSGEFPMLLSEFQLKRVSALGGMIKVKDELKFVFDLICVEQE